LAKCEFRPRRYGRYAPRTPRARPAAATTLTLSRLDRMQARRRRGRLAPPIFRLELPWRIVLLLPCSLPFGRLRPSAMSGRLPLRCR